MTIQEALAARALPALASREAMLHALAARAYGWLPQAVAVRGEALSADDMYGGKARQSLVRLHLDTPRPFAFPLRLLMPLWAPAKALLLYISFSDSLPNPYLPAEELLDLGYAITQIHYTAVCTDDGDWSGGLPEALGLEPPRDGDAPGKIGLWAWAMHRAVDWLLTQPELSALPIVAAGHSRLGKTALWAAANDTRIAACFENDSGCAGIALSRGKAGETVAAITERFPYWFCPDYRLFAGRESAQPFDQHFLAACVAPRPLFAASALSDAWADPQSEFLGLCASSVAWPQGLEMDAPLPDFTKPFGLGTASVGYHLRKGGHGLNREDWLAFDRWFSPLLH